MHEWHMEPEARSCIKADALLFLAQKMPSTTTTRTLNETADQLVIDIDTEYKRDAIHKANGGNPIGAQTRS